jgi:release factor glutamine methyltransferase
MTVAEALAEGTTLLRASGVETARLDASLLLAEILQTGRTGLILVDQTPVSEESLRLFRASLERRSQGVCTAYILGRREFRGLDFTVTPDVLVPRPDTETLVEAALNRIDRLPSPAAVLDLCTGSGAVAIALKHERPFLTVYGSDISAAALRVARLNAARLLGAHDSALSPIIFIESDLFEGFRKRPELPQTFDLIVANPPYIPTGMIETLSREVQGEPRISLDGGENGLVLIERLITEAPDHISPGGALLIEADPRQMAHITGILSNRGYDTITREQDLSGKDRVIGGIIPAR